MLEQIYGYPVTVLYRQLYDTGNKKCIVIRAQVVCGKDDDHCSRKHHLNQTGLFLKAEASADGAALSLEWSRQEQLPGASQVQRGLKK